MIRVGYGYDVHPFAANKPLILGGVLIEHTHGLHGHSDADALLHAICDALLGACGKGDIGEHFPDTDPAYAGADSAILLERVVALIGGDGWQVVNVDATLVIEKPKLLPYKNAIRARVAQLLDVADDAVNIKATTSEKMGFVGRSEGVAVMAVALIQKGD